MEHDPAFEHEIDVYVSDEDEQPRQTLRRLTTDAMSYLSRAYPNPVDEDRERLQRFHRQAVSFLDRAYAEDPATLVTEEHIPPEQLLQRFHNEAMSFLDVAPGPNSAARVERDKARLEQHYQDAMSFLNRADKGRGLIEEQELEVATVERFQLQKYAREAMSFLDKAFREDASVMVEDEDLSPRNIDEDSQIAADRAALERYDEEFGDFLSKAYLDDSTVIVEDADSETSGMEGGLYARKMAASTTSAETGYSGNVTQDDDFTDEAYTDDEFQDPELSDRSQLELIERNLPPESRNYEQPETSADFGTDHGESLRHRMARYEREAEDYLEGANVSESEDESVGADTSGDVGHVLIDDEGVRVELDADGNVLDAKDYVEESHADNFDDDDQFGADREIEEEQQLSARDLHSQGSTESTEQNDEERQLVPLKSDLPDLVSEPIVSPAMEAVRAASPMDTRKMSPVLRPLRSSSGRRVPRVSPNLPPRSPDSQNLMVDMILESRAGQPSEWSEVQLERSFYRQLPRGSTIKLRPKESPQLSFSSRTGSLPNGSLGQIPLSEFERVEQERDAALATLEEIVNERSLLAAQVSEMKSLISKNEEDSKSEENQDIDLAAELKEAHETMARLTEEMEATLAVVDERYHSTLERAHKAEERCIRLEANGSRLEREIASQGMRLSQAISEEQRMHSMLVRSEKEFDELRRKSEKDIQRIDETYREESDHNLRRIRELSSEVTMLQGKLDATTSTSDRSVAWTPQKRLEIEVSTLKRRLAESERKVVQEQIASERKIDHELRQATAKHNEEIDELASQLDRIQIDARGVESVKRELEREKIANKKSTEQIISMEHQLVELQNELIEARRGQIAADAEAKHVRLRYEESLKKRIAQTGHSSEMVEIQTSLHGLKEEAANRERVLQQQLEDFRQRAEEAKTAASQAEQDAQEAAEVARQGRLIIESERKARRDAEAEVNRIVLESRAWEKLAQQSMENSQPSELAKSSSKRGIRKSPPNKDGKKKKERAGASDEPRKKSSHRPRLFG